MAPTDRGSSPVDWCEGNYKISADIAEFVNTVSNIPFLLIPLLLSKLFKQYAQVISRGIYIIWALIVVVGVCSIYFHATLSLLGQLLDELAIIWLMTACFCLWMPRRMWPIKIFDGERKPFQMFMVIACATSSVLCFIQPAVNAFALFFISIPVCLILALEVRRCTNERALRLGYRSFCIWFIALFCWLNDRLLCDMWSWLKFPYLHGAWHVLMASTALSVCVLFAYFEACNEAPEKLPALKYWPQDWFEFGFPYVILKNGAHSGKDKI